MNDLKSRISELETLELKQTAALKAQAHETMEALRPLSLLKNAVGAIAHSGTVRKNLLNTSLGIGAGLVAKKLFFPGSKSIIRKVGKFFLQTAVTKIAANGISKLVSKSKQV